MATSHELTAQLLKNINDIRLNEAAGVFGTTSSQSILHELQQAIARFSESLQAGKDYGLLMKDYESLAASLDTAGITGLISESEITGYYELLDDIWAALEREKEPPDARA